MDKSTIVPEGTELVAVRRVDDDLIEIALRAQGRTYSSYLSRQHAAYETFSPDAFDSLETQLRALL